MMNTAGSSSILSDRRIEATNLLSVSIDVSNFAMCMLGVGPEFGSPPSSEKRVARSPHSHVKLLQWYASSVRFITTL